MPGWGLLVLGSLNFSLGWREVRVGWLITITYGPFVELLRGGRWSLGEEVTSLRLQWLLFLLTRRECNRLFFLITLRVEPASHLIILLLFSP